MLKIIKSTEIDSVIGQEVGVSDWITIDQDRISADKVGHMCS